MTRITKTHCEHVQKGEWAVLGPVRALLAEPVAAARFSLP
jgi:hypothetical protein